jgi:hypothetical protein
MNGGKLETVMGDQTQADLARETMTYPPTAASGDPDVWALISHRKSTRYA